MYILFPSIFNKYTFPVLCTHFNLYDCPEWNKNYYYYYLCILFLKYSHFTDFNLICGVFIHMADYTLSLTQTCSGVAPANPRAFTSDLPSSKATTTGMLPYCAAQWIGMNDRRSLAPVWDRTPTSVEDTWGDQSKLPKIRPKWVAMCSQTSLNFFFFIAYDTRRQKCLGHWSSWIG